MTWSNALLLATALHVGFQLTVSVVVYPALARVPEEEWATAHASHSRRIAPVVGLVYLNLVIACAGAVINAASYAVWLAVAGTVGAFAVTAFLAVPLHQRLGAGPDPVLTQRLLRADWARTFAAFVALLGAVLASTS